MTDDHSPVAAPWHQVNLRFPHWRDAEDALINHIGPLLRDAEDTGSIGGWWFVRKGECLRVRLRTSEADGATATLVSDLTHTLAETTTLTRHAEVIYEPEIHAFGGRGAMNLAHDLFEQDSHFIVRYLAEAQGEDHRKEIGVVLATRLLGAAGLDYYEQGDVWAQVAAHRTPAELLAPRTGDLLAVQRLITSTGDADGSPLADEPEWSIAFEATGFALRDLHDLGRLGRGLRAVLAHHLLFHFNRLGISADHQHQIATAAHKAVFHRDTNLRSPATAHLEPAVPDNVDPVTADTTTADPARLREALVTHIDQFGTFRTPEVRAAFNTVPRHLFLPDVDIATAYAARGALVTKRAEDGTAISSASSPNLVAAMLEQLGVRAGSRILEIGAATGINAALLAELTGPAGHVVTIELDEDLAYGARAGLTRAGYPHVEVICGDGALGHADAAPYDRIIVTAGAWDISAAWWDQLAVGGRIVVPLRLHGSGLTRSLALDLVEPGRMVSRSAAVCGFVPMRGAAEQAEQHIRLAEDAVLRVDADDLPDEAALTVALQHRAVERSTGIQVRHVEPVEHLDLWLATNAAASFGRVSMGAAALTHGLAKPAPRWAGAAIYDGGTLAYLVTRPHGDDADEIVTVAHGPESAKLIDQMADLLSQWSRDRPAQPTISAYRTDPGATEGTSVVHRPETHLTITW